MKLTYMYMCIILQCMHNILMNIPYFCRSWSWAGDPVHGARFSGPASERLPADPLHPPLHGARLRGPRSQPVHEHAGQTGTHRLVSRFLQPTTWSVQRWDECWVDKSRGRIVGWGISSALVGYGYTPPQPYNKYALIRTLAYGMLFHFPVSYCYIYLIVSQYFFVQIQENTHNSLSNQISYTFACEDAVLKSRKSSQIEAHRYALQYGIFGCRSQPVAGSIYM